MSEDAQVQLTTDEASLSKLSSINMKYFEDPFLHKLVTASEKKNLRRSPLVNRGYYTRVKGIRHAVKNFLDAIGSNEDNQIVNLGCGLDSFCFYIKSNQDYPTNRTVFFEIDHPEVTERKRKVIENDDLLKFLASTNYTLIGADLRDLTRVKQKLTDAGLRSDVPTLFISECVLIYMETSLSNSVLKFTQEIISDALMAVVVYEQTNPNDAFGRVMVKSMQLRKCPFLGIHEYPDFASQKKRYLEVLKFDSLSIGDMNHISDNFILVGEEKDRIAKLEIFDEFEEWRLMQNHYFIAVACKVKKQEDTAKFAKMMNCWDTD
jgi:tRNA wybutosine-synthesizing protein 4